MKATLKSFVAKVMTAGLLAGAFAMAGGAKAEAQTSWNVGVQMGGPVYGYPAPAYGYYGPDYYARLRYQREREAYERHQAWLRQQEWLEHERHEAWEREQ